MSDDIERQARAIFDGCGNHGCRIQAPRGQATNGPCRCWQRIVDIVTHAVEAERARTNDVLGRISAIASVWKDMDDMASMRHARHILNDILDIVGYYTPGQGTG